MHFNNNFKLVLCVLAAVGMSACSKNASTYDTTSAEVTAEVISGVAATTDDSSGSLVSFNQKQGSQMPLSQDLKLMAEETFESKAMATGCTTAANVKNGSCTGDSMTIDLNSCTTLYGSWSGSYTLAFSSGACTTAHSGGLNGMTSGETMTLTSPSGVTYTAPSGYSIESDSSLSGYSDHVQGGLILTCGSGGCSSNRTVSISGMHRKLVTPTGATLIDHSYNTSTAFAIAGVGANKTITAGTLVLQHNLIGVTATSQITTPLTFSSGCCQPTGGAVTTTFTGAKTGTESVTFGPSCGVASVNGTTVSLGFCQ